MKKNLILELLNIKVDLYVKLVKYKLPKLNLNLMGLNMYL